MASLLASVPVDQETKAALSEAGIPGRLRPLYHLTLARESGQWQAANELGREMQLSESDVAEAYWQAMVWAREVNAE